MGKKKLRSRNFNNLWLENDSPRVLNDLCMTYLWSANDSPPHFVSYRILLFPFSGRISGQKVNWGQNGEINGRRNFLVALVHGKGRHGMHHPAAKVGPILFFPLLSNLIYTFLPP